MKNSTNKIKFHHLSCTLGLNVYIGQIGRAILLSSYEQRINNVKDKSNWKIQILKCYVRYNWLLSPSAHSLPRFIHLWIHAFHGSCSSSIVTLSNYSAVLVFSSSTVWKSMNSSHHWGCSSTRIRLCAKNCFTNRPSWTGALYWCRIHYSYFHKPGLTWLIRSFSLLKISLYFFWLPIWPSVTHSNMTIF